MSIPNPERIAAGQRRFLDALGAFRPGAAPAILCHHDTDGLSAGALLARALGRSRFGPARTRVVGRGEHAWSEAMRAELRADPLAGLVVADLGLHAEPVLPGTPTIVVDHHVPVGVPSDEVATAITGHGMEPTPTSSLLAHWCAGALLGDGADDLLWLAALGLVGDLGERGAASAFPEVMAAARRTSTAKALREASALVNAPRRSSGGDAGPALALLMRASGPADVLSGEHPETALLRAAQDEVKAALDEARRVAPRFAGSAALIEISTPCQIHPLVAQQWTARLRRQVVICANHGYRPGWVHFAARSAAVPDLIAYLAEHAPDGMGPEEQIAQGHRRATGGQVRPETWARLVAGLGFR